MNYIIQAPDGSRHIISDNQPDAVSAQPDAGSQFLRQVGLTARAGAQGVLGIPAAIGDALGFPSSKAVNNVLDAVGLPAPQNATERFANSVASGMVAPGVMSNTLGSVLPALTKSLGTQTIASGVGSGSADIAREMGAGPLTQFLAGLAGGVAVPTAGAAAATAARAGGRALAAAAAPLTQNGRLAIAARAMQGAASDPGAAAGNIASAQQYVPGVAPTTAEVAGDSGIASLYKALRNQSQAPFTDREVANDAARQAFAQQAFGTRGDIQALQANREAATSALRSNALGAANTTRDQVNSLQSAIQAAQRSKISALQNAGQMGTTAAQQDALANSFIPVPGMPRVPASLSPNLERVPEYASGAQEASAIAAQQQARLDGLKGQLQAVNDSGRAPLSVAPLLRSIQGVASSPGLRASDVVTKTLGSVQQKLASLADSNGVVDAQDLYTVRKEIGNTIGQYAKESNNWDKRFTASLERDIQGKMDSAIVNAGGESWPEYLRVYSDMSRSIGAKQLGQDIVSSSVNPQSERLSPAQFARQMAGNEDVAGAGAQVSDALTRLNMDLKRSVAPSLAMKTAGSDTLQNMVGNDMVQNAIGRLPGGIVTRALSKVASVVYSPAEQQTKALLLRGMLDPQFGQMLLTRQLAQRPDLIQGLLGLRQPIAIGGLLGAMSAQ